MKRTVIYVVTFFAFVALCVGVDAKDSKIEGANDGSMISESNPQPSPSPNKLKRMKIKKLGKEAIGESNPQPSPSPQKQQIDR